MNTNEYITTNDVAHMMRVTPEFVRKLVKKGKLHPEKVGNTYIYDGDEVSQYFMSLDVENNL